MIELGMYVALGFLAASLIALLMSRPLWRRAVRLTTLRLESTLPMSRADMEADKDELRAQYAIKLRNFELALEKEKAKSTRYLVDRNKSRAAAQSLNRTVAGLKAELAERDNQINVLQQNIAHAKGAAPEPVAAPAPRAEAAPEARPRLMAGTETPADGGHGLAARPEPRANGPLRDENARLKAELETLRTELAELRGTSARDWELLKTEVTDLAERILQSDAAAPPPAEVPAKAAEARTAPIATLSRPLPKLGPKKPAPSAQEETPAEEATGKGRLRARLGSLAQRLESLTEGER
jgi:hypothetical protein